MTELTGDAAPCSQLCYCARPGLLAEIARLRANCERWEKTACDAVEDVLRLRAAFKDILLIDGKRLTARQRYAQAATLSERALGTHA